MLALGRVAFSSFFLLLEANRTSFETSLRVHSGSRYPSRSKVGGAISIGRRRNAYPRAEICPSGETRVEDDLAGTRAKVNSVTKRRLPRSIDEKARVAEGNENSFNVYVTERSGERLRKTRSKAAL